jgi:hypothetical protein
MTNAAYNLPIVIDDTNQTELSTDQYFSNLYNFHYDISPNVNDAVQTYFQEITEDRESARLLAATVIYTAIGRGTDPMVVLEQFRKVPRNELNLYVATFLNLNRVNTSLLGVKNPSKVGYFIKRSIRP